MKYDPREIRVGDKIDIAPIGQVEVIQKFPSWNRLVLLVRRVDGVELVIKFFSFRDVPASLINWESLRIIQNHIHDYKQALRTARVFTSKGVGFAIKETINHESVLIQWEDYLGATCSAGIKEQPESVVVAIVEGILRCAVQPLFDNAPDPFNPGNVIVGLDLNPRNLTWQKDDQDGTITVYVIDLFPPKIWDPHEKIHKLEFPEPNDPLVRELGFLRHFKMFGLILNLWTNLAKVRPNMARIFYDQIETFLRTKGFAEVERQLDEYLLEEIPGINSGDNLLIIGSWPVEKIKRIIERWGFKEIFKLRALACAIAFQKNGSQELLEQIFTESHFQNNKLEQRQITRVGDLIIAMANKPSNGK
ncbi:hypothetical protein KJ840_00415 [Patescibacteria group bacterium]|nr:hypothetical protein [Patescibacteria group bacterium]